MQADDASAVKRRVAEFGRDYAVDIGPAGGPPWVRQAERASFPAASLAKLVILMTAISGRDFGAVNLSRRLRVTQHALRASSPTLRSRPGDTIALGTLLGTMIVESDNVAANVVLEAFGVDAVNRTAMTLGMSQTHVYGVYKDSAFVVHRASTSAGDLTRLLRELVNGAAGRGKIINRAAAAYSLRLMSRSDPDSRVRTVLPPAVPVCMKTGLVSDFTGYAILLQPLSGKPISVVFLHQFGDGLGLPGENAGAILQQDDATAAQLVSEAYRRWGR
ncbi:MAG: hypothetical protein JWM87_3862 [Candidatus Eremiobacteraeota bacterium]|nr:hypothetical protein [Candidatus Eremiobacteraeota bacterium]